MDSKTYTVAELISVASVAMENATKANNPVWVKRWRDVLDQLRTGFLPAGCGYDSGTTIELATASRIIFGTSFHHMNDAGYYDGWTDHKVTARAEFGGIGISIGGVNRNDIKEYIAECFDCALSARVSYSVDPDTGEVAVKAAK